MPLQPSASIQNSFIGGFKTEFTGLNFPKNAATETENCVFDIVGDVTRRLGFDYEDNFQLNDIDRTGKAISTYRWKNVRGDGSTEMLVQQVGNTLYFYKSSDSTVTEPLSTQKSDLTIDLTQFLVEGSDFDSSIVECEYSDGNGYLFVYNPYCTSFYIEYDGDSVAGFPILLQTRDFTGYDDNLYVNSRPSTLSNEHNYNLQNQGWTQGTNWTAQSYSGNYSGGMGPWHQTTGSVTFTDVQSGLNVEVGQSVIADWGAGNEWPRRNYFRGVVTAYSGTSLTINVNTVLNVTTGFGFGLPATTVEHGKYVYPSVLNIYPTNTGYIGEFFDSQSVYPSNSDVWWRFKNSSDAFDPSTTAAGVTLNTGAAPKGHFILTEFDQDRGSPSNLVVDGTSTKIRPRTGSWFAGRVWYAGIDASSPLIDGSDASAYNWSENIYFSQVVTTSKDFGNCYQTNDPTAEDLFDLLPTDGGVISIQGCGKIFKLFPIQNGMLVFCQNGIWFITGSKGIGFSANDYTITQISSIQSMSSTSFVNVMGLPYFWNEEGIYSVSPTQQGIGLQVQPVTVDTILSWYNEVPAVSKAWVRGAYDPINYVLTWVYRSTKETDITDRYEFDSCLNFNTYTKAFYPYTLMGDVKVNGINYVSYPNVITAPDPGFKYLCSVVNGSSYDFTFAEEKDEDYVDFESAGTGTNYISYFITGYELTGQGQRRFQPGYVIMYSRADEDTKYKIQGIFDYAISPNSGQFSSSQLITNHKPNYGMIMRRHSVRGHGYVLQLKVTSVDGEPFDIMGWSIWELQNAGV